MLVRPHYLLKVDPDSMIAAGVPESAQVHLRMSRCVVVRRGAGSEPGIPIGIRGAERNQRWAALCQPSWITRVVRPPELLQSVVPRARSQAVPALRALEILKSRWRDRRLVWGPGGSVGFELATGIPVTSQTSDLDIIVYADTPMTKDEAKLLCDGASDLNVDVDIRVETPRCGFSLREYARESPAPILLRLPGQVRLGSDPWGLAE
ncbi:MAG: malonate decarboxylase holo-ACP synthase [Ignavibacteriota bacterium]